MNSHRLLPISSTAGGILFLVALALHTPSAIANTPIASVPVLCYHQLDQPNDLYSISNVTFAAQMDKLLSLGYSSITPDAYVAWLHGKAPTNFPTKPILITFDDNILNAYPAGAIMKARGLSSIMFTVSGFADFPDGWNMDWTTLHEMQASGAWHIQLHAGPLGHSQFTSGTCVDYLACRLPGETAAAYETRVDDDLSSGLAALQQHGLLVGNTMTFALPWDDWGQTGTDAAVTGWLPQYLADRFDVVFDQDWGYAPGFNRRYRFEVHSDHTMADFEAALSDSRFLRVNSPTPTLSTQAPASVASFPYSPQITSSAPAVATTVSSAPASTTVSSAPASTIASTNVPITTNPIVTPSSTAQTAGTTKAVIAAVFAGTALPSSTQPVSSGSNNSMMFILIACVVCGVVVVAGIVGAFVWRRRAQSVQKESDASIEGDAKEGELSWDPAAL